MSAWTLAVKIEWPHNMTADEWQALLREVVDPLHRENVIVYEVGLTKDPEA